MMIDLDVLIDMVKRVKKAEDHLADLHSRYPDFEGDEKSDALFFDANNEIMVARALLDAAAVNALSELIEHIQAEPERIRSAVVHATRILLPPASLGPEDADYLEGWCEGQQYVADNATADLEDGLHQISKASEHAKRGLEFEEAVAQAGGLEGGASIEQLGRFLVHRLDELDFSMSMHDFAREYYGHVIPALERLKDALSDV